MALTKEQRAAKFAQKSVDPGLVSRGNRKLTIEELHKIYKDLDTQKPDVRIAHLRSLRESLLSGSKDPHDKSFERKVYERSVVECLTQGVREVVPHLLSHLCGISTNTIWRRLYLIVLSNSHQYSEAVKYCTTERDAQYLECIIVKDTPAFTLLVSEEKEPLAQNLMRQMEGFIAQERKRINSAYR